MKFQIFHNFLLLTDYVVLQTRNIDLNEIFILLCIIYSVITYVQKAALYPGDFKRYNSKNNTFFIRQAHVFFKLY